MLDELHVHSIALIDDATLEFAPSLTVLTGETGAGKTALLASLSLVCGKRADATLVRDGCSEACVQARLVSKGNTAVLDADALDTASAMAQGSAAEFNATQAVLDSNAQDSQDMQDAQDDSEIIITRRLSAKGRSRCTINGNMATVSELAASTSFLHIHSQHEHVRLIDPHVQCSYLDEFTGLTAPGGPLELYRKARSEYRAAADELCKFEAFSEAREHDLELARFTLEHIDALAPQKDELEELETKLPRLQNAEALAKSVSEASSALNADGAALDLLAGAWRVLEGAERYDTCLTPLTERMKTLCRELEDITRDVAAYGQSLTFDSGALEETLSRLAELNGLMRRFGPSMDDVLAARDNAAALIENTQNKTERLSKLRAAVRSAHSRLIAAANKLDKARRRDAAKFCECLRASVSELAMPDASFEFSFEPIAFEQWQAQGQSKVELLYRPASGASARPLARIASGGELSRILLALECMHYTRSRKPHDITLVFDEVDAGVGGKTGAALARYLRRLATCVQVIVVTHLPQIAAVGDRHYLVSKSSCADNNTLPSTSVTSLSGKARIEEIARMLSGHIDKSAREHARLLLQTHAQQAKPLV